MVYAWFTHGLRRVQYVNAMFTHSLHKVDAMFTQCLRTRYFVCATFTQRLRNIFTEGNLLMKAVRNSLLKISLEVARKEEDSTENVFHGADKECWEPLDNAKGETTCLGHYIERCQASFHNLLSECTYVVYDVVA